jgi:hypothetical protein
MINIKNTKPRFMNDKYKIYKPKFVNDKYKKTEPKFLNDKFTKSMRPKFVTYKLKKKHGTKIC